MGRNFTFVVCLIILILPLIILILRGAEGPQIYTEKSLNHDILRYVNPRLRQDTTDVFDCVNISMPGDSHIKYPICVYSKEQDQVISKNLIEGKPWEKFNIQQIIKQLGLKSRGEVVFIDIGANIGTFTLAAASAGYDVIAVEPMPANLRRLQKSILLGNVQNQVTVVQAGISNATDELYFKINPTNRGGSHLVPLSGCVNDTTYICYTTDITPVVYMDDLLPMIHFSHAVIKIDIEGLELAALQRSQKLFESVNVYFILMEFFQYKKFYWEDLGKRRTVERFLGYMKSEGYIPCRGNGASLADTPWNKWTDDITWVKPKQTA